MVIVILVSDIMLRRVTLSLIMLNVVTASVIRTSVVTASVVRTSVVRMSVVRMSVVAPKLLFVYFAHLAQQWVFIVSRCYKTFSTVSYGSAR
jgi:hypothetical protein